MSYIFNGDIYAGRDCGCEERGREAYGGHDAGCNECGRDVYDDRGQKCDECGRNFSCDEQLELAIATVPMQRWRLTYSHEKALGEGTMFAELNLPFKGGKRK